MNIAYQEIYRLYFKRIVHNGIELKSSIKESINRIDYMLLKVYNRTPEVLQAIKDINKIQKHL